MKPSFEMGATKTMWPLKKWVRQKLPLFDEGSLRPRGLPSLTWTTVAHVDEGLLRSFCCVMLDICKVQILLSDLTTKDFLLTKRFTQSFILQ